MSDHEHELGLPASGPDVMNDPAYDNNTTSKSADGDKDTCRICRSEGTPEEPLFHPCKCSGSIKHVHQDCLMEWLSHTNKKHCELCKTSFRFTKLYDADMPDQLPLGIFVTRACLHIGKYFLTWMRAFLVGLIWLIILPWAIRWAWRGLFFMMDAGWAREPWIAKLALEHRDQALRPSTAQNATLDTAKAILPEFWAGPIYANFVFGIWNVIAGPWKSSKSAASLPQDPFLNATIKAATSTLLSDLDMADTLTDSPSVNRAVLDIMEGQIITIVVVIAFILVFLIREWVIQQQPILNAAAHVREAQQQLDRVERARQRLRDEIRVVEEQLERLNDTHYAFQRPEQTTAESSTASENLPYYADGSARVSPQVDWPSFERRVRETSDTWITENAEGSPESVTMVQRLTAEVITIIEKARNGESSDVEVFGKLIDWVRQIPPEVDSAWLSQLAAVFSQLKPHHSGTPSQEEQPQEPSPNASSSSGMTTPDSWEDEVADVTEIAESANADQRLGVQTDSAEELEDSPPDPQTRISDGTARAISHDTPLVDVDASSPDSSSSSDSHDLGTNEVSNGPSPVPEGREDGRGQVDDTVSPVRSLSSGTSPSRRREQAKQGILDHLYDFFWGEIDTTPVVLEAARAENANENPADAQVIEVVDHGAAAEPHDGVRPDQPVQDPEVVAAAAEAGLDAEAIEDAEDLEGVLELIGMQGPIAVLFQTALFCGLLVTVTLWGAVGAPYLFGKLALQILGDPVLFFVLIPLRTIAGIGDFVLDIIIFVGGAFGFAFLLLAYQAQMFFRGQMNEAAPMTDKLEMLESAVVSSSERAAAYLTTIFAAETSSGGTDSYFLLASLQAHHSLNALKSGLGNTVNWIYAEVASLLQASAGAVFAFLWKIISFVGTWAYLDIYKDFETALSLLSQIKDGKIFSLTIRQARPIELDPILSYWSGSDRALTILIGYVFLALLSIALVMRSEPMFSAPSLQKIEKSLVDVLKQAGGVVKVILIISIEMLLFPLYCGVLLDIALMPLFEGVTFTSRLDYAQNRPYMFTFLHWFLGTAYMFNFALFVSMCRRILRSGVLYFIRDPDDPTFHPVRDVLERNISTQLRKIAFSALVYGLMVILCLGGIVWSVAKTNRVVFPLRWSTPDPVLEFPAEFLFYNFISPFLFKLLQPSRGLESTYEWWLRKCARRLRLSHFLFGERNEDEEKMSTQETQEGFEAKPVDGSYVRVPASDQVRVQRGQPVFVPVSQQDVINGEAEQECSLHGRPNQRFRNVYIPPWFRMRIGFFLGGLWMMCAAIGVGFTIVPLLLGRGLCTLFLPSGVQVNDIWAYSSGLHFLLFTVFTIFRGRKVVASVRTRLSISASAIANKALHAARCTMKSFYVYGFAVIIVPTMAVLLIHFYFVIPSRTYLSSFITPAEPPTTSFNPNNLTSIFSSPSNLLETPAKPPQNPEDLLPLHHIYILPDWTLGFVLSRFFTVIAHSSSYALPAAIYRQLTLQGRFNPDIRLATRAFVLPCLLVGTLGLLLPLLFASSIIHVILPLMLPSGVEVDKTASTKIYRYAYPIVLGHVLAVWGVYAARKGVGKWKERIKDEVYLVGERLHNFGERRPPEGSRGVMKKGKEAVREGVEGIGEEPVVVR
ncbi:ERAD-associated E3 ubiquitin-protein ligase doa10 [Elsinoe australis]|uniref:RING-type E3 ubiquitin transferase n=1 Tax=Elsinoe australis TaxID=40998 RepID=A0A2P7Z2W2_9PEZI|nr:ERAD-associated E3 ubiquitin-protein ligase doa10 [Elsinoe australis]